jgi:hypothetical protein
MARVKAKQCLKLDGETLNILNQVRHKLMSYKQLFTDSWVTYIFDIVTSQ